LKSLRDFLTKVYIKKRQRVHLFYENVGVFGIDNPFFAISIRKLQSQTPCFQHGVLHHFTFEEIGKCYAFPNSRKERDKRFHKLRLWNSRRETDEQSSSAFSKLRLSPSLETPVKPAFLRKMLRNFLHFKRDEKLCFSLSRNVKRCKS
jgi:hypothetical protein